jgi:predicted enzyme related to lactoylglutathione lyase
MPSMDGTIVYLNAGDNLQSTLDKVRLNGGKVVVPKTQISPEIGFFAMFTDTEGNKLGLHSIH